MTPQKLFTELPAPRQKYRERKLLLAVPHVRRDLSFLSAERIASSPWFSELLSGSVREE